MVGYINSECINHIKTQENYSFINNKTSSTGNKLFTYKTEMTYLCKRRKNELYEQGILLLVRGPSQEKRISHAKLEIKLTIQQSFYINIRNKIYKRFSCVSPYIFLNQIRLYIVSYNERAGRPFQWSTALIITGRPFQWSTALIITSLNC